MESTRNTRSTWAWAAVILQGSIFLSAAWGFLQTLLYWQVYAHQILHMLPLILRAAILTAVSGISLVGLWRSKGWGWILAVLTDSASCLLTLSSLLQFPMILRNPKWVAFSVLDLLGLALLIHRPVRACFLGEAEPREISSVDRFLRVLVYFAVAVIVTCLATSFAITMLLGQKGGGVRGFLFFGVLGFEIGALPSFLFALLLTLAGRFVCSNKLWAWLLAGAVLAPGLTFGISILMSKLQISSGGAASVGVLLAGPQYLYGTLWLTISVGLITAFLCYQMFPWSFGEAD